MGVIVIRVILIKINLYFIKLTSTLIQCCTYLRISWIYSPFSIGFPRVLIQDCYRNIKISKCQNIDTQIDSMYFLCVYIYSMIFVYTKIQNSNISEMSPCLRVSITQNCFEKKKKKKEQKDIKITKTILNILYK